MHPPRHRSRQTRMAPSERGPSEARLAAKPTAPQVPDWQPSWWPRGRHESRIMSKNSSNWISPSCSAAYGAVLKVISESGFSGYSGSSAIHGTQGLRVLGLLSCDMSVACMGLNSAFEGACLVAGSVAHSIRHSETRPAGERQSCGVRSSAYGRRMPGSYLSQHCK